MTVIVGWKCNDGVVVGADRAATLGAMGEPTVKEIGSKLVIVKGSLILGVSGPVGLAQRFCGHLDSIPTPEFNALTNKPIHIAMTDISRMLWGYANEEYQRAAVVIQAVGNRGPITNALNQSLIAVRINGEDRLIQFTETCSPEEATDDLPYVSIGSGQRNADPFLAFLRNMFWEGGLPKLEGGIFATLWTLDEIIRSSPGGLGGQPQIATLQNGTARLLEDDDLQEHGEAIESARQTLRDFRGSLEPQT